MMHFIEKPNAARSGLARLAQRWRQAALVRSPAFRACFITSLLAAIYWNLLASDRYVSEAHIIVQRTDAAGGNALDVGALFGATSAGNRTDQLLLRDHLLSVDMLDKLDARLNLRAHYSDRERDLLSRMWSADAPQEWFHRHYLSRVNISFDDYAGVLVIKAQAYDATTARAVTAMLVEEGERTMNRMAQALAHEQVAFVEKQVTEASERFRLARKTVLSYQNEKGLVAPQSTAESLTLLVNRLDAQRSELQARRSALLGYLSPRAPAIVEAELQIAAIEKQIAFEQARLAGPNGKTLNSTVEEFQRLQMAADLAQDVYKAALVALEKSHAEATRTLRKVTVVQLPTLPQYPLEPGRIYNTVVFILAALALAGIAHLLAAIVRDHKE